MADSSSSYRGWLPPRPPGEPERAPAPDARNAPPRFAPPVNAGPAPSRHGASPPSVAGPEGSGAESTAERPRFVKRGSGDERARPSGLSIGSAVLGVLSLVLLVFTLGLSALGSMALAAGAWLLAVIDRRRARERDPQAPPPARAGRLLGMLGVVLAALALLAWSILIAEGGSPEGVLEQLREQLEEIQRRQQGAPVQGQGEVEV